MDFYNEKLELNVPEHIAIILDGNGRWAKKRGLPRSAGHSAGADSLKKIVTEANNLGIKYITDDTDKTYVTNGDTEHCIYKLDCYDEM